MSSKGRMFYCLDEIDSLLVCAYCAEKLVGDVKCLPCEQSICGACHERICRETETPSFVCKSCQGEHEVSDFTKNAILDKLLALQPKRVTRGDKFDSLHGILEDLQSLAAEVRSFHGIMEIENYCERLTYEVTLATESAIEHLNDQHRRLLEQIGNYKCELVSAFEANRTNYKSKIDLDSEKLLKTIDEFRSEWARQLEETELNDASIGKAIQKGTDLKNQMRSLQDMVRKYLFKDRYMRFTENESFFISHEHLGQLEFYNSFGVLISKASPDATKVITGTNSFTLRGHKSSINSLIALPDGNLASSSDDTNIRIWNPMEGTLVHTLAAHNSSVRALVVLTNGNIASGSWDHTIKIWNPSEGKLLFTLTGHTNTVGSLLVLPNGYLASGSWDKTIKIWNPFNGTLLGTLAGHTSDVYSLACLPNGNLASGSLDATVRIWSLVESV